MFNWFIDLAYSFQPNPDLLYMLLFFAILFLLCVSFCEFFEKLDLEQKAENYEKLKDFLRYDYGDESNLRSSVIEYLSEKKYEDECVKSEKEIDDFMNIL